MLTFSLATLGIASSSAILESIAQVAYKTEDTTTEQKHTAGLIEDASVHGGSFDAASSAGTRSVAQCRKQRRANAKNKTTSQLDAASSSSPSPPILVERATQCDVGSSDREYPRCQVLRTELRRMAFLVLSARRELADVKKLHGLAYDSADDDVLNEANDIINANASDLSCHDDDFEDSGTDLDDEVVIGDWVEISGLTSETTIWVPHRVWSLF